jgi:alpha-glucosidase
MLTRKLFKSKIERFNTFIFGIWILGFSSTACATDPGITSPNGAVQFKLQTTNGPLQYSIFFHNKPVIELSPMHLTVDGVEFTDGFEVGALEPYYLNETYDWRGAHSRATNSCNGARITLKHPKTKTAYTLEIRSFNEAGAFRFIIPETNHARVPDEATTFKLPEKSTLWYHDLEGHYEGVHVKKDIREVKAGEWVALPATFKLPDGLGYASITEAFLTNYAGMALQADGQGGLIIRLGHSHPPSHPYRLRYSQEDIDRLAKPAEIAGPITTPWRVIMIGSDLNALVNNDTVPNLCTPPDPRLFPKGLHTDWVKPGRAAWKYLDGGGSNTLATAKEFTRMAGLLSFEHHVIEGYWSRWTDQEIKELVSYAKKQHVGLWFWKHSRSLRDSEARHEFLKRLHDLGVAGAKIDFFDHEAKEVIDLYQSLLKEAAQYRLLLDFHGANKPAGESRTWPNELTREAVKGMEASKLPDRATHDTTLPFTRMLAGPAEYTPMVFGPRRANTTYSHQIATAAIFSAPLLTYGCNPSNMLASPCLDMIKSIPATWDETIVLPPSEIGELAAFARRVDKTWFLILLNGLEAKKVKFPLGFLPKGDFKTTIVRDNVDDTAGQSTLETPLRSSNSLTVDLHAGGGFIARFEKE